MKRVIFLASLMLAIAACVCTSSANNVRVGTPVSGSSRSNNTVTITAPVGTSRTNPAPLGTEVTLLDSRLSIVEVKDANVIVAEAAAYNPTPSADQKYLLVTLNIVCVGDADHKCSVNPIFASSVVDSTGVVHEYEAFAGASLDTLMTQELYGGASVQGDVLFL